MFRNSFCTSLVFGGAVVILLLAVESASAQQRSGPRIPADAHGYQALQLWQQWHQQRSQSAARAATAPVLPPRPSVYRPAEAPQVTVAVRTTEAKPVLVDVRGLDGEVRTFPVTGGAQAITVRQVTVRPGEQVTISVPSAK